MVSGTPKNSAKQMPTPQQSTIEYFVEAAQDGNLRVVRELLNKYGTAIIDEKRHGDLTALMMAARYGRSDMVDFLLQRGASTEIKGHGEMTILIYAVLGGDKHIVECMLERGVPIDAADKYGRTALTLAQGRFAGAASRPNKEVTALIERHIEKAEKQRLLAEQKEKFLKDSDFSRGLKQPIPRPRLLNVPHRRPKP